MNKGELIMKKNTEVLRLKLENRISKLSNNPTENAGLIKKAKRQLRALDK